MNKKPITSRDLDRLHCDNPQCDHQSEQVTYLHPRCHPGAGNYVFYDSKNKTLHLECATCKREIIVIAL